MKALVDPAKKPDQKNQKQQQGKELREIPVY